MLPVIVIAEGVIGTAGKNAGTLADITVQGMLAIPLSPA